MKILKIALFLLSIILLEKFCHSQTAGFAMGRIHSDLTFNAEWEVPSLLQEEMKKINNILDQKFFFLGSGRSFYAFVSEDQNYVIKLFKFHHIDPINFYFPFAKTNRGAKLLRDFSSCKIAYTALKEETGVLFLHLNKTNTLKKKLTLVDKLGIEHSLDLDKVEFLVQNRATMACAHLTSLIREGKTENAKESLGQLWEMLISILEKGIEDHDMNIETNCGFINGRPLKIDVGPFKWDPKMKNPIDQYKILKRTAVRFQEWLQNHHPELCEHFETITEQTFHPEQETNLNEGI